ncbi:MAG: pyridoxal 5'-phosphate synthase glutaminase subunit PdxT, partial [Anaerotardibacter sp.]
TLTTFINDGMPVLGTCAGLILMAQEIDACNGDGSVVDEQHNSTWLATLPVTVRRNAYGRQLGSFFARAQFMGLGEIPMTFIRAPFITECKDGVEVLATVDENIVAVRYQNQIGVSFHPELDTHQGVHGLLLSL